MATDLEATSKQVILSTFEPSKEHPSIKTHRVRETSRARGIPKEDACLREKVYEMFDFRHIISYSAYRDMALYSTQILTSLTCQPQRRT